MKKQYSKYGDMQAIPWADMYTWVMLVIMYDQNVPIKHKENFH